MFYLMKEIYSVRDRQAGILNNNNKKDTKQHTRRAQAYIHLQLDSSQE